MDDFIALPSLGWKNYFQQQLSFEELESSTVARVIAHHRSEYIVQTECQQLSLPIMINMPKMTVGDWLLISIDGVFQRLLDRLTLLSRKAAGSKVAEQLIASNVDYLFITVSLNHDFNLNRIERYLAIAHESGCEPVVILTKADLVEHVDEFKQQVQSLDPMLAVECVNGLSEDTNAILQPWCKTGNTVALVGSSGVGKSTLVNTLLNKVTQETQGIREDDSKGKHTTTSHSLHFLEGGGILIDTPGIRELQISDCQEGIEATFSDISELTQQCKFNDCQHGSEPGCAVQKAIQANKLDERRLDNYRKLIREQERNSASIAQMRSKDKAFGRLIKSTLADKAQFKR